jgi:PBP1b-binding outer membrane lipoprotein LpoB
MKTFATLALSALVLAGCAKTEEAQPVAPVEPAAETAPAAEAAPTAEVAVEATAPVAEAAVTPAQ